LIDVLLIIKSANFYRLLLSTLIQLKFICFFNIAGLFCGVLGICTNTAVAGNTIYFKWKNREFINFFMDFGNELLNLLLRIFNYVYKN